MKAALLVLLVALVGCVPPRPVSEPIGKPMRLAASGWYNGRTLHVFVAEIDGAEYVIAQTYSGVSITPKVQPNPK